MIWSLLSSGSSNSKSTGLEDPRINHPELAHAFVRSGLGSEDDFKHISERLRSFPVTTQLLADILTSRQVPFPQEGALLKCLTSCEPKLVQAAFTEFLGLSSAVAFDTAWQFARPLLEGERLKGDVLHACLEEIARVSAAYADSIAPEIKLPNPLHLDALGAILSRSLEPHHDLELLGKLPAGSALASTTLHDIYDRHPYIADPRQIGITSFSDAECDLRLKFASGSPYLPLQAQSRIIATLEHLSHSEQQLLLEFVQHCRSDEAKVRGCITFLELLNDDRKNASDYLQLLRHFSLYSGSDFERTVTTLADIMQHKVCHISELTDALQNRRFDQIEEFRYKAELRAERRKSPEKDLATVRAAFLTPEHGYSEPPPSEVLDRALKSYEQILRKSNEYLELTLPELTERLEKLRQWRREAEPPGGSASVEHEFKVSFIALTRNIFERRFGIYPYNTQILNVLMMTDEAFQRDAGTTGIYAQIKTGEGKSLLFAMLASYYALPGQTLPVISSNSYLAERDALKFAGFFKDCGVTSAHFSFHQAQPNAQIVYTTSNDLIFEYLTSKLDRRAYFGDQPFHTTLVDESDNLCLDQSRSACRIGHRAQGAFSNEQMQTFIRFHDSNANLVYSDPTAATKRLMEQNPGIAAAGFEYVFAYLESARKSAYLKADRDFVWKRIPADPFQGRATESWSLSPVDISNTGRVLRTNEWSNGLHQMILLRHAQNPEHPLLSVAQMAHPTFLKMSKRLLCITGTIGDRIERQMTRDSYRMVGYDSPPHHPSRRLDSRPEILLTKSDWLQRIEHEIMTAAAAQRPALVITQSIEESEELAQHLRTLGRPCQLLNDHRNQGIDGNTLSESEIIARAGNDGAITIATSVAGRGADIVTAHPLGLICITTFIPENVRVEYQARGRAGRLGKEGESKVIACVETDMVLRGFSAPEQDALLSIIRTFGATSDESQSALTYLRRSYILDSALRREAGLAIDDLRFSALEKFFEIAKTFGTAWERRFGEELPQKEQQALKDQWARIYDRLAIFLDHHEATRSRSNTASTEGGRGVQLLKELEKEFEQACSKTPAVYFEFQSAIADRRESIREIESSRSPAQAAHLARYRDDAVKEITRYAEERLAAHERRQEHARTQRHRHEVREDAVHHHATTHRSKDVAGGLDGTFRKISNTPDGSKIATLESVLREIQLDAMKSGMQVPALSRLSWPIHYLRTELGPTFGINGSATELIRSRLLDHASGNNKTENFKFAQILAQEIRQFMDYEQHLAEVTH